MKKKAGRPSKYGTETKPMRIPVSLWQKVLEFIKQEMKKSSVNN